MGYNQGGILGSNWYSTWDMIGDSYLGSIWSTLRTTIRVQSGVQTVKCLGIGHFIIVTEIGDGDQTATELEQSPGDGSAEMGPGPDTAPTLPPLPPLASAIESGAVSREDAGQLCTVAGPLVAVGGGGVRAGDGFITGVAGGEDGTGVTPAPPADDVQHRWPPPLGAAVQQCRFLFCSNMSATQCRTLQMNLSYVTPSSPLTHWITGLLLPS